ncbi:MAG: phenylacetate--CoA ligase family protein [Paracoccaceae bacterium]
MPKHFDGLETREQDERERSQFECLRALLANALPLAPGLARHLDGVQPDLIVDRKALARLPVLRKSDLMALQKSDPPFGGLTTRTPTEFTHVFQSPGPIYEPGMDTADWWRFARALWAGGLRPDDVVLNCFAYHLTPAGLMFDSGARALGASVLPGGVGNTEAQALAAADLGVTAYAGTPDFLKVLMEKAAELGRTLNITKAIVGGGPLFPKMREYYRDHGISCVQGYGTADLGSIAYEALGPDGLHTPYMIVDEGLILEIVRPGTGDPVAEGEVGEVLVSLLNADYPLIRFATGDMSAMSDAAPVCGRTGARIKGWMGRADQTTKVRGMFVRPEQVAEVLRRHPDVTKARLTVGREDDSDSMVLAVETEAADGAAIARSLRDILKLRADVRAVAVGSLPNDGKVIDDTRDFG